MAGELSEVERREAIARFEAVGIPAVQLAVHHPQSSPSIFGAGVKASARRALADEWLSKARPRERRRRCRQEVLLWAGSIGAVLAAIFGGIMLFR